MVKQNDSKKMQVSPRLSRPLRRLAADSDAGGPATLEGPPLLLPPRLRQHPRPQLNGLLSSVDPPEDSGAMPPDTLSTDMLPWSPPAPHAAGEAPPLPELSESIEILLDAAMPITGAPPAAAPPITAPAPLAPSTPAPLNSPEDPPAPLNTPEDPPARSESSASPSFDELLDAGMSAMLGRDLDLAWRLLSTAAEEKPDHRFVQVNLARLRAMGFGPTDDQS